MRILWLSHFLPYPPKGGMLQRTHNLLKKVSIKHDVFLFCLNQAKLSSSAEQLATSFRELKKICTHVEYFPIPSDRSKFAWASMAMLTFFKSSSYYENWLRNDDLHRRIKSLSLSDSFDLIHLDTIGMVPYSKYFHGIPIVLNHHNIESQLLYNRYNNEKNFIKKIYLKREADKVKKLEMISCPSCEMNLVVSDLDGVRLKKHVPEANVTTVENGVDVEYFKPVFPLGHSKGGLIFAGGMNWFPNRDAILHFFACIWPRLLADDSNRHVTIIGKNPPIELLQMSKDPRVKVTGFVDDVRPYLNDASIYICPIRIGGGTRLKIIDAMAMAKPLVATKMAVEGLDLVENEHYLRAESPDDFVVQIKRLENDEGLRIRLAIAERKLAQNRYSWDIIGNNIEKAYRKAVSCKINIENK